jgi:hypothetical protein
MEMLSYELIVRELAMNRLIVSLTLRRSVGGVYLIVVG